MRKRLDAAGLLLTATALAGQLVLSLMHREAGVGETLLRFFGYFTILTNLLVGLYFLARVRGGRPAWLAAPGAITAVTAYILVVGLVYQLVLRGTWSPTGWQRVVDELLHTVNPLFVLVYWRRFAGPGDCRWGAVGPWLAYAVGYLLWVTLLGLSAGFYPYPFVDAVALGYGRVALNALVIVLLMLGLLALLIGIGRRRAGAG